MILNRKSDKKGWRNKEMTELEKSKEIIQFIANSEKTTPVELYTDEEIVDSYNCKIIGKNDASSTIKVSSDRISMFSAGKEVMYISQGVINIDNGIFTASVQIGRFRTEQYHLNKDVNVIRYVG